MFMTYLTWIALYLVFAICLVVGVFGGAWYGAIWMKLPKQKVTNMIELASLHPGVVVYDLGAGFGNITFKAAQSGAKVVAVEADWFKAWWIRRQIKKKQLSNVTVVHGNLLNMDLSKADVLLCYLSGMLMKHISQMPLKQGCLIVSAEHKIHAWTPVAVDSSSFTNHLYAYKVGLSNAAGLQ